MRKLSYIAILLLCQLSAIAQTAETKYTLTIQSEPENSFYLRYSIYRPNQSGGGYWDSSDNSQPSWKLKVAPGQQVKLTATLRNGFKFVNIQSADTIMPSTNYALARYETEFTMPDHDAMVTAVAKYDPDLPGLPGEHDWDEATGTLLVTSFTPDNLITAIEDAIKDDNGYADKSKVKRLTVVGMATNNDLTSTNTLRSLEYLDLSRTDGISEVSSYTFRNRPALKTILLPASITVIRGGAFDGCTSLENFTCHATTPPTLEKTEYDNKYPFDDLSSSLTVYVPAESLPLYTNAEGWKGLNLMPIIQGVHSLTVNMPAGADMQQLKDLKLELANTKTGQTRRYVLTNRTQYTFTNLIEGSQYHVYLKNAREDVLGTITDVEIDKQDVQVTFADLKSLRDITIQLFTPESTTPIEESMADITWTDAVGNFLAKGTTLTGQADGAKVIAKVKLGETLGTQYLQPADTLFAVCQSSALALTLAPLPQTTLNGIVTAAATGLPIRGANVAVTQLLNGLYPMTTSTTTDAQGRWTLAAYATVDGELQAPAEVNVQATGYVPQNISPTPSREVQTTLSDLVGTTINLDLSYRPAVRSDEQPTDGDFSGWADINYTVYDKSHGRELTNIQVQGGRLVLQDQELGEGTRLRVTAKSINGLFADAVATCTVSADGTATATLPLVQLGQLRATFSQTDNTDVVGMLYDADGQLQTSGYYSKSGEGYPTLTLDNIADGRYTLVTMGESRLFNGVNTLGGLTEMRLVEGRDYISNDVNFQAGRIDSLHNQKVPMLDESVFYWTTENTTFTVNKSDVTVGNYLTLRTVLDFKSGFDINGLKLRYDLPEGCELVEGSVMVGNALGSYSLEGNRVVVPLKNRGDQVRFCVIPANEGRHEVTASVSFNTNRNDIVQPLGAVGFNADALSINMPEVTSGHQTLPVSGIAMAGSQVQVYDGDVLIGQTEAGPAGNWTARCLLHHPYNLSRHEVHAVVTTADGITMQTGTKTVTVEQGTLAPVVTMSFGNISHSLQSNVKWDFRDTSVTPSSYATDASAVFTFYIDFMVDNKPVNDTTKISNVTLYVLLSNNDFVELKARYHEGMNKWVAQSDGEFGFGNLPENVCVDYVYDAPVMADREQMDDMLADKEQSETETQQLVKEIYALPNEKVVLENQPIYDELERLLSIANPDEATLVRIESLINILTQDVGEVSEEPSGIGHAGSLSEGFDAWLQQWRDGMLEQLSIAIYPDTIAHTGQDIEDQFDVPMDNGVVHFTSKKVNVVEEQALLREGYSKMDMTDGTAIYMLQNTNKESYIDTRSRMQYTFEWQEGATANSNSFGARLQRLSQKAALSVDSIFDRTEKAKFKKITFQLYDIEKNSPLHTIEGLATEAYLGQARTLCRELAISSNNLYSSGLKIITKQVIDIYEYYTDSISKRYHDAHQSNSDAKSELSFLNKKYSPWYKYKDEEERQDIGQKKLLYNRILLETDTIMKKCEEQAKETEKAFNTIYPILRGLPRQLGASEREFWVYSKAMVFEDTPLGVLLQLYWCFYQAMDVYKDLSEWRETYLAIRAKLPCDGNEAEARKLYNETLEAIISNGKEEVRDVRYHAGKVNYAGLYENNYELCPHDTVPLSWFVTSWVKRYQPLIHSIHEDFRHGLPETVPFWYHSEQAQLSKSKNQRKSLDKRIRNLKCNKKPKDNDNPTPPTYTPTWLQPMRSYGTLDPSGYVYEAVSSNRLEGVRTTCYYKETKEDMYGDLHENVVLWDAENYAQENPLFTDAEGMYRWDVPQGLWQVKYEKEGYETTYSEWLPVPPPQLEVNIGMTQLRQPAVQHVKACTDGIDITFDKYMRPKTLNSTNILVTKNGQAVGGKIELLNADSGYQTPDSVYVSKVRFTPATPLTLNDKVQLTVRRQVESYAGLQMEQDFTQQFDVEQRITAIVADSLLYMSEGGSQTLTVRVLPAEAAKGKQLKAVSFNKDVVTVRNNSPVVTLDQNGSATLDVFAASLGSSVLKFCLTDDEDLQATTLVIVRDPATMYVQTPKASRMSGTEIYRGAEIKLTCATTGATILYTLDGSCPCEPQSGSVMTYTGPITAIGNEMVIKAMAVANGMAESDVAEFHFKVIDNIVGIEAPSVTDDVPASVAAYYRLDGRRISTPERGLNIVRYTDGTTKVVVVK